VLAFFLKASPAITIKDPKIVIVVKKIKKLKIGSCMVSLRMRLRAIELKY